MADRIKGKARVITDAEGKPIDDIDTDMIFHNAHLHITDISKMGVHAFGNMQGYEDYASTAQPGEILVVGKNFGAGSSRQQAVDCFVALGVRAIVGESFGAIYRRNAINKGFPLVVCDGAIRAGEIADGDELVLDLAEGTIENVTKGAPVSAVQPASKVQLDIIEAGSLLALG